MKGRGENIDYDQLRRRYEAQRAMVKELATQMEGLNLALVERGREVYALRARVRELEQELAPMEAAPCDHIYSGRCQNIDGTEQIFCAKCGRNPPA